MAMPGVEDVLMAWSVLCMDSSDEQLSVVRGVLARRLSESESAPVRSRLVPVIADLDRVLEFRREAALQSPGTSDDRGA